MTALTAAILTLVAVATALLASEYALHDRKTAHAVIAKSFGAIGKAFSATKRWLAKHYVSLLLPFGGVLILWAFTTYLWQLPSLIGSVLRLLTERVADGAGDDIRSLAYAFAALTGALALLATVPFQLVKVWVNERSTRTAEENLTTNLINTAVQGLGAEKEVNRLGRSFVYSQTPSSDDQTNLLKQGFEWIDASERLPKGANTDCIPHDREGEPWKNVTLTVPNIVVRLGAIYALERLAQDSERDRPTVANLLSSYVRSNSGEQVSQTSDADPTPAKGYGPVLRADIAAAIKAVRSLATRRPRLKGRHVIHADFSRSNFQGLDLRLVELSGCDLSVANFRSANLSNANLMQAIFAQADLRRAVLTSANLKGANLRGADLRSSRLDRAILVGADLKWAHLERAVLRGAHLEGADLVGANLVGAILQQAHLEGATLRGANLEGTFLTEAHLKGADLEGARMRGVSFNGAYLERAALAGAHLNDAFLEGVHLEGANLRGAHLQGAFLMAANLQGAALDGADFKGANILGAQFSGETSFRPKLLRGAGLKDIDLTIPVTDPGELPHLLAEAFGDDTVTLPYGLKAGEPPLEHWATGTDDWGIFESRWRDHQRAIGYTPPKP